MPLLFKGLKIFLKPSSTSVLVYILKKALVTSPTNAALCCFIHIYGLGSELYILELWNLQRAHFKKQECISSL